MSSTPGFGLEEHPSSGADSHVWANTAYRWLELFSGGLTLKGIFREAPDSANDGDAYITGLSPTDSAWVSNPGEVALNINGNWIFKPFTPGMRLLVDKAAKIDVSAGGTAEPGARSWIEYWAVPVATNDTGWRFVNIIAGVPPVDGSGGPGSFVGDGLPNYCDIGTRWTDTSNDKDYICTKSGSIESTWVETTGSGGGSGDVDQNLWGDIVTDLGTATPASPNDSLSLTGQGAIFTTAAGGDAVTVGIVPAGPLQNGHLSFVHYNAIEVSNLHAIGTAREYGLNAQPVGVSGSGVYITESIANGGSAITGGLWSLLGASPGYLIYFYGDNWYAAPPAHGMEFSVGPTAASSTTSDGINWAKTRIRYDSSAAKWHPVEELHTTVHHFTGKYTVDDEEIWAAHYKDTLKGPIGNMDDLPTSGDEPNEFVHNVTIIPQSWQEARGFMQRTSGAAVSIPQNFLSIVVEVRVQTSVIQIWVTDGFTLSGYKYNLRFEYAKA
jgi:hypothetical protein